MKNQQIITEGLALLEQAGQYPKIGNTAVLHRLDPQNAKLTAYLIAERQTGGEGDRDVLQLFRKTEVGFDESELAGLCFELGVDVEDLNGRSPFRRFKDVLFNYPAERERWFAFSEQYGRKRIDEWLQVEDVLKSG